MINSSLSHVALLVSSVEDSATFLNSQGIKTGEPETFDSEGTKEIYVGSYDKQKGLLLLLESISEGPYLRALKKRGPSLHHIAIDVLNIEDSIHNSQKAGWILHPVSDKTMPHKTAWLFFRGVPTLIEIHQKKELSKLPSKISKIELPIRNAQESLFESIGLGGVVFPAEETCLTVDGSRLSFSQIACLR